MDDTEKIILLENKDIVDTDIRLESKANLKELSSVKEIKYEPPGRIRNMVTGLRTKNQRSMAKENKLLQGKGSIYGRAI